MLNNLLLVFIGGGIGSILRFGTNSFINHYAFSHIGTLVVNVLGSFLFGIIVTIGEGFRVRLTFVLFSLSDPDSQIPGSMRIGPPRHLDSESLYWEIEPCGMGIINK